MREALTREIGPCYTEINPGGWERRLWALFKIPYTGDITPTFIAKCRGFIFFR